MFRYVSNRLITSVVLALFATLVVFLIASVVPGDPILAMLGDLAASKPEIVAEYRARWGLDLPLWQQYWIFLQRLFHGDLGISISTGRPVLADIAQYAPATVELGTIAFVNFLLVAFGVLSMWQLVLVAFCQGTVFAFNMPGIVRRRAIPPAPITPTVSIILSAFQSPGACGLTFFPAPG